MYLARLLQGASRSHLDNVRAQGNIVALKTFKDEYSQDAEMKEMFRKEATLWVDLGHHSCLMEAIGVDEVDGRLYILMQFAPSNSKGFITLQDYLDEGPVNMTQALRWAIQLCHGMEYAYSKGIRCHRDIKPSNIMISPDLWGNIARISDFGLAGVLSRLVKSVGPKVFYHGSHVGLSSLNGNCFGTPTHMSPEQFTNAKDCDERSDIYAFGIVLYQMATGGRLPFLVPLPRNNSEKEMRRFCRAMHRLHSEAPVPKLDSPLFPIILRCLEKEQGRRYQNLKQLRADLELLLERSSGETVKPPKPEELEAWEWSNKGLSLDYLGRSEEAIACFDRAVEIDPQYAGSWNNKGLTLVHLGRFDEAVKCCDKALETNPQFGEAWSNKGISLRRLGRFDGAIACFDRALEINPQHVEAWVCKGNSLHILGRFDEAIKCYNKALEIDPQFLGAWSNKGGCLFDAGRFEEAIRCFHKAVKINPRHTGAWFNKASVEDTLGRRRKAARSYSEFIELVSAQGYTYSRICPQEAT